MKTIIICGNTDYLLQGKLLTAEDQKTEAAFAFILSVCVEAERRGYKAEVREFDSKSDWYEFSESGYDKEYGVAVRYVDEVPKDDLHDLSSVGYDALMTVVDFYRNISKMFKSKDAYYKSVDAYRLSEVAYKTLLPVTMGDVSNDALLWCKDRFTEAKNLSDKQVSFLDSGDFLKKDEINS